MTTGLTLLGSDVVNLLHSGYNVTSSPDNASLVVTKEPPRTTTETSAPDNRDTFKPNALSLGIPALIIVGGLLFLVLRNR